jgi:Alpha/beta hydrolase domain
MRQLMAGLCLAAACFSSPASARVERIEIVSRQAFAAGTEFGHAGAYEKLRGRALFALDPNAAANGPIADLKLAPRNDRGMVEFSAEFLVLRPADATRRNGTLLYEVNNRGNIAIFRQLNEAPSNNDPSTGADAGNGFLLRHGFTLVWSAWASDVATTPGDKRLVLRPPIATRDGTPITGKVAYELIVDAPRATARFTGMLGTAYPFAREAALDAMLTERDRPDGERRPIPRAAWSFVAPGSGAVATEITLDSGFKPGRIYELTYTARDPMVVAAGMAGIRDLISYLRNNPLVGAPPPQACIIFGISQSARLIQTMLLRGLHVDEDGRPVFDGAFIHVAGAGKGGFDYRFAMPTRHFSVLEDHIYPTDFFPFATATSRDPVTDAEGSVLDRGRALGAVPKLFYVNNSSEYWNRAASLIATDPAGARDLEPAPHARLVPKPDADGLDQGGIVLPELLAPLGTRTGFNTRNDAAGFPWATGRWDGSFVPFPRTERERQASGDPRVSLEARYADRAAYEAKVRSTAADVVGRGFLLPEDVDAVVDEAGSLYDRIMAHDPADRSCDYLFGR